MTHLAELVASLALALPAAEQAKPAPPAPRVDAAAANIAKIPTLYVVGYAHLDTQWRWTYIDTIREYIPNTLRRNFALFDKYPGYIFNFSGSRRYRMMEEYYPDEFAKLKRFVATGQWFPCGSSVDENDANVPSAESLVRHVLYGNKYFRDTFGEASNEYMLPDCFGFPASLPSVLAHCGVRGFSTQKLTWNAVVPIPFKVGVWNGPDGKGVIAALDPGAYVGEVRDNLANSETWLARIKKTGEMSGAFVDYHYFGTGDTGGAPDEPSVKMVEESIRTDGPVKVVSSQADWLCDAITPPLRAKLPVYQGELELTEHSAGSVTSQAYMKRWNRKNELLADDAERASVAAWWLGARPYPAQRIEDAWYLVLGSQMHDILPGTSLPRAYELSWNDEVIAANQFGGVLTDGASAVIATMKTAPGANVTGTPIVVFNPLSFEREDVVEFDVPATGSPKSAVVFDASGKPIPAQVLSSDGTTARIAAVCKAPSVGFTTIHVACSDAPPAASTLRVAARELENDRYLVKVNDDGDVSSIYDKQAKREMLSSPLRLGLHYENPRNWPAWNQDWEDRQQPARAFAGGPAEITIVENGPARVALQVRRGAEGSTFTQRIRLASGGAGDRVEFDNDIDWRTRERSVRAAFPLAVRNEKATYDVQTGVLERGNFQPKQYEYGFQQWFDLTDAKGDYGVAVACDSKYGADKPDDGTVRLTLLHTPGTRGGYPDQGSQDLGKHHLLFALSGHQGDWRQGRSPQEAMRLNQPLVPFATSAHDGASPSFSLAKVSSDSVAITALKKAEDGDAVVVRLRELSGRNATGVRVAFAGRVTAAQAVDGQERDLGPAKVVDGELVADVDAYSLAAYKVKLAPPQRGVAVASASVPLTFDADVVSTNAKRDDGAFDPSGGALPAEQLPTTLPFGPVTFELGATKDGAKNALVCNGQTIPLPQGAFDRVYILAAADVDTSATLTLGASATPWRVQSWNGMVGQWDRRLWAEYTKDGTPRGDIVGLEPGYVKPDAIAWYCSHHHRDGADAIYSYSYLYAYPFDLPKGATSIQLPKDPRIKVFAVSVANAGPRSVPASPLFDTLIDHVQDAPRIAAPSGATNDSIRVAIAPGLYWRDGSIRYTLDGSEPTKDSNVYAAPIELAGTATIKAAVIGLDGRLGPVASAMVTVNDTTAPRVTSVEGLAQSKRVAIDFSERIAGSVDASKFTLTPPIGVSSAQVSADGRRIELTLAAPLAPGQRYRLAIPSVRDASHAGNAMTATTAEFAVAAPIYRLAELTSEMRGTTVKDVAGLPTRGSDPWTMNAFVRTKDEPKNRTVLFGFGRCDLEQGGACRYFCKFANGLQLWVHNRDVPTRSPLDVGAWQMLTATYDGMTVRLYKNGHMIGERENPLADDANEIMLAPMDPWEHRRQFDGEIRDFTIWNVALGEETLRALAEAMPKN
ncbi:MAG: glycoside hydrolase family 38 C-terminal domain-containing protein [Phycisphaerales bacterium]